VDAQQYQELKERLAKATGKEKKLLAAEFQKEEEKLRLEKSIFEMEGRLGQGLNSLHQLLSAAVDRLKRSAYPYDAKGPLPQARVVLTEILALIKEAKAFEDKLVGLVKAERKLLKKEREVAKNDGLPNLVGPFGDIPLQGFRLFSQSSNRKPDSASFSILFF
jgi:hypothetical protein